eukprot:CAMPEP_0177559162 /NCGR_PEP_ID=MMETSP0369-20130122/70679_1 /TAXON_ID=447022 ORGANISM="Scrippsiella hangoei-like, Strain SHHI-4" /NCGR_SAMPLE_ID=MMETSP0369 /ASSEMBLY_ACC=CAM_ASM_000364 /LENGTH=65 /DNA_ID=CAMNT_0019045853 /DNA_START=1 /DNA_END=198 /DNA_ORIENTATION=+
MRVPPRSMLGNATERRAQQLQSFYGRADPAAVGVPHTALAHRRKEAHDAFQLPLREARQHFLGDA